MKKKKKKRKKDIEYYTIYPKTRKKSGKPQLPVAHAHILGSRPLR
jgi:hypothetical protein